MSHTACSPDTGEDLDVGAGCRVGLEDGGNVSRAERKKLIMGQFSVLSSQFSVLSKNGCSHAVAENTG